MIDEAVQRLLNLQTAHPIAHIFTVSSDTSSSSSLTSDPTIGSFQESTGKTSAIQIIGTDPGLPLQIH